MKQNKISFFTILFLLSAIGAQAQFKIDFEYRPRAEFRDGYRTILDNGESPSFIVSQRTRLTFSYETDKLKAKFTPQDVRVWGDEGLSSSTGVYGDEASLDLHEAYVELKLNEMSWLSIGRQEFSYDHERLLARRNWNQNGLSYDALLLKMKHGEWNVHLAGSWNAMSETTSENYYLPNRIKSLNFLWLNRKFQNNLNLSFLHIASGVTQTDTTNTLHFKQTTGLYCSYNSDAFNFLGNAYYQFGKNSEGHNVDAYLLDVDFSYKTGRLTPGLGGSYLSGNSNLEKRTDHLFDVLYGARHRFFGHMDYFRSMASHTMGCGLVDLYGSVGAKVSKNIQVKNTGHYFRLAEQNAQMSKNKALGYENELEIKYKLNDWSAVKAAYLFYLPTDTFKAMQNVTNNKFAQFAFLELTINPTMFNNSNAN